MSGPFEPLKWEIVPGDSASLWGEHRAVVLDVTLFYGRTASKLWCWGVIRDGDDKAFPVTSSDHARVDAQAWAYDYQTDVRTVAKVFERQTLAWRP
jgi:hypothetical protein